MKIDEQIKILLKRKAEIELFTKLADNLKSELAAVNQDVEHKQLEAEHPGLLKDFCNKVSDFCQHNIEELSQLEETRPKRNESKVAIDLRPEPSNTTNPPTGRIDVQAKGEVDPLRFLLANRHLERKRVRVQTKDGPVEGVVRGLIAPNVLIETDLGHQVRMPPEELTLI